MYIMVSDFLLSDIHWIYWKMAGSHGDVSDLLLFDIHWTNLLTIQTSQGVSDLLHSDIHWTLVRWKIIVIQVSDLLLSDIHWTLVNRHHLRTNVSDLLLSDKYKHPLTALIGNEGVLLYLVVFSYLRCNFSRFCTNKGFLAPTALPWLFCLHLLSYISLLLLPQPPQLVFCWLLALLIDNLLFI